jgi:rhomboid protease GluP
MSFGQAILFKLRFLLLPLLLLSVIFTALYSALNWFLVARNQLLSLDADVANVWLPGVLSCLLAVLLIQPRLRVLRLGKKHNIPFLYAVVAIAVVAVPAIAAQAYVKIAAGEITHLADAAAIAPAPSTKYYAFDHLCLAHELALPKAVVQTSGQHNETLSFNLYVAIPTCQDSTGQKTSPIWIGLTFHKNISNGLSDVAKNAEYEAFLRACDKAIYNADASHYRFFERAAASEDRRNFEKALQGGGVAISPPPTILIPHAEIFEQRTGDRAEWIAYAFGITAVMWLLLVLVAPLADTETEVPQSRAKRSGGVVLGFLVPRGDNYGLALLLDINIGVFVIMVLAGLGFVSFQPDDLLVWGANYRPAIHGLGILRLIFSQFVHGGVMHLANNMYGLFFAAIFLLPVAGNYRLIAFYLVCGLGASIASIIMHPATVSVGASGAIFGLCGILITLVLLGDTRVVAAKTLILINIGLFIILNLLLGAVSVGIDNAAHVGGLITGCALGLIIFLLDRSRHSTANAGEKIRW